MQYKNKQSANLRECLGKILKKKRENTHKSCNKLEEEFEFGGGVLNRIENAKFDCKFITLWKICEALEIDIIDVMTELKNSLGKDFHIIDK